jgi:DNA-binding PadR family transcriptional regulator
MNPTRLFVLGALASRGPMYGHQIRRDARVDRTELWSEVRPGSLYGALHRMHSEGLIEPVRTEQEGNLPARTVYAITAEGHKELRTLRAEALRQVGLRPDPVDLALAMSADLDQDTLRGFFADRRQALASQAAFFAHERERGWPDQGAADELIMDHAIARIEAELRWHDMVLDRIGKLSFASAPSSPQDATAGGR